ncbi:MAG: aminotransferase class I/II-fold pyridoxal phosphate-dependent enzyme [Phycisphaerales bacterium]|nr:aminotransferase class I/II-fold pyridoxal phosphate-dependent enzyme [Phycisphaerales bacterium]
MKIPPFRIEQYFSLHEFTAPHLLSSSDAESVAVADILALEPGAADRLFLQQLRYTESPGAPEMRAAASGIYKTTAAQDIVVVSAAEEGIFAAYHALLQPGDHVVVETPCYESALQLARTTGAEVRAVSSAAVHSMYAATSQPPPSLPLPM